MQLVPEPNAPEQEWHTDWQISTPSKTCVLYLNDNDGYTVVGETKVESKRGRIVIFPSDTYHFGTSSHQDRCVIIINYFPQYNEY